MKLQEIKNIDIAGKKFLLDVILMFQWMNTIILQMIEELEVH